MVDWRRGRRSTNIEDRRGARPARGGAALGGGGLLIIIVLALLFGVDPSTLLNDPALQPPPAHQTSAPVNDEASQYLAVMLATTEDTWSQIFARAGERYQEPTLVLFSGATQSGCGFANAAIGPFYCPADRKLYLDTEFFADLQTKLGAEGDFAQAYVVAHEVGHHVQTLLGTSSQVRKLQARATKAEANALSVRMELQADCYAGVWAHYSNDWSNVRLEAGDLREAMGAAAAVGDDRLQKRSQGYVVPESFTHGTSDQRMRWFETGYKSGAPQSCDTFSARAL